MNVIPGGMNKRSAFGSALIGLGLAVTSVGFLATAPSASATPDPDLHCSGYTTNEKYEVPRSGSGSTTVTVGGVAVTITVNGDTVAFTDSDGDPLVVNYCLKASTGNTGQQSGSGGDTDDIPNNGGQTPGISYVVVYSVPGPTTPASSPTSPETSPTTVLTEPTETVTEPTETPTETESTTTPTVLPTESSEPTEPAETESTTTPTVLPTSSTDPVDPETSTTPTVLPTASTAPGEKETSSSTPTVLGSSSTAPAQAPTAVDAGLAGGDGDSGLPSSLLILLGAAMAVLGLGVGFLPIVARGKHSR
jgi:hypothetical protein